MSRLDGASPMSDVTERILRKQNARDAIKPMVQKAIEAQEPYLIGNISIMATSADSLQLAAIFEALEQAGFPVVSHSHAVQELLPLDDQPGKFVPKLHINFVCRTVDGKPKTVLLA